MTDMMTDDVYVESSFSKIDADLAALAGLFRDVLKELGEEPVAGCMPWLENGIGCADAPGPAPAREIQLLSIAFQLLNLIEETASVQTRRDRERAIGTSHDPGLWAQNLRQLHEAGFSPEEIKRHFSEARVEVVLTAHPTEARRPAVLRQHRELYDLLNLRADPKYTPREQEQIATRIKVVFERLWRTVEMYGRKPTVETELDNVLLYLREIFPQVLPALDARLRLYWERTGYPQDVIEDPLSLPTIAFGDWVGGDRDGHPLVTPDTTRMTLGRLRDTALELLEESLTELSGKMTLYETFQTPPEALREALARQLERLSLAHRHAVDAYVNEPWRQYV